MMLFTGDYINQEGERGALNSASKDILTHDLILPLRKGSIL